MGGSRAIREAAIKQGDNFMTTSVLDPTNEQTPEHNERAQGFQACRGNHGAARYKTSRRCFWIPFGLLEKKPFVLRYIKPTFTKPAPVDLRHEVQLLDAVIEALAD